MSTRGNDDRLLPAVINPGGQSAERRGAWGLRSTPYRT